MNPIPTRLHGVLDYLWVITVLILPRLLGCSPGAKRLLTGSALFTLVASLLTRYELGALKLMTMPTHLRLDTLNGVLLAGAQSTLLRKKRQDRNLLLALSIFGLAVVLASKSEPSPALYRRQQDNSRSPAAAKF
jgi:hypothetical protein